MVDARVVILTLDEVKALIAKNTVDFYVSNPSVLETLILEGKNYELPNFQKLSVDQVLDMCRQNRVAEKYFDTNGADLVLVALEDSRRNPVYHTVAIRRS